MNILYVLNSGRAGGMEKHVLDLVAGMKKEGHNVYVWAPAGTEPKLYQEHGAEVFEKYIRGEIDFKYILGLKKFLKDKKIDVLHAHEIKAVSHSLIAGKLAGVKGMVTHTHTPISTWKINKIKRFIDVKIYSFLVNFLSHKEIALTSSVSEIKKKEGIKVKKLVVLPNAVPLHFSPSLQDEKAMHVKEIGERYGISESDFVFGVIGRMSEEKGHSLLVDAFNLFLQKDQIKDAKNNFKLLLAGGGVSEEDLKKQVKKQNLEKLVIFTGIYTDEDKPKFLSSMHVFINPSFTEGFGITPLEALVSKIPLIYSDIPVLREVIGDYGKYFKKGSAQHLSDVMFSSYSEIISGVYSIDMEEAKRFILEKYSMETFTRNYLELYKSLL